MSSPSWLLEGLSTRPRVDLKVLRLPFIATLALIAIVAASTLVTSTTAPATRAVEWTPRALPGAMVEDLDPLPPLLKSQRPKSSEPLGGIAFVRCTRLWSALPDGSAPTRLLEMSGVASPTFSPDAKTIAFIRNGSEIWMVSADGRNVRRIGALKHDGEFLQGTIATSLTWSPTGRFLAFALMSPGQDMWSGGASIWKLDIHEGNLTKEGSGWPSPTWRRHRIVFSGWNGDDGPLIGTGNDRDDRKLSRDGTPYAATFNNGSWWDLWDRGTVVLKEVDGELMLGYRTRASQRKDLLLIKAPSGFVFTRHSRPALSQDVGRIVVDLAGRRGDVASGIFDLRNETWTVLDHAWDPATSPAPTISGPLGAKRAFGAANDFLNSAPRGTRQSQLLLDGEIPGDIFPNKGWGRNAIGEPIRSDLERAAEEKRKRGAWDVPAMIYGPLKGAFGYRNLTIRVGRDEGRLTVRLQDVSPVSRIESIEDAVGFLRAALPGIDVPAPAGIPEGARLDPKYPVEAYTWDGLGYGLIRLELPKEGKHDFLAFGYGDVSFSIGCGGAGHLEEEDVSGTPGLSGRVGDTRQILWPATRKEQEDALYTVYGTLPKDELMEIALEQA